MDTGNDRDDVRAIEALIARQFHSLTWSPGGEGDWRKFAADFVPEATLYPAARPVKKQTVDAFIERMKGQAGTKLRAFNEVLLGTDVRLFGNVAVALAACEITENDTVVTRGIEMLLLVKSDGAWQIVSQAWDMESPSNPIPSYLINTEERP